MIKVGQRVRFDPMSFITGTGAKEDKGYNVIGKVVSVNKGHKWFLVEYKCGGNTLLTSFKFCDIGDEVTVLG